MNRPFAARFGVVAVLLVLFLGLVQLPVYVSADTHDIGSQAAIEYWTYTNLHFGTDIVQNVGPLGFLNYPRLYAGFLDHVKIPLFLTLMLMLAALALAIARTLPNRASGLLFLAVLVAFRESDVTLYAFTLLIGYGMFCFRAIWVLACLALLLAILSLAKGTLLFSALLIVAVTMLRFLHQCAWPKLAIVGIVYPVALLTVWVLCGQPITNIPDFLVASVSFSSGYNEAMAFFEHPIIRALGFAVALLLGLGLCYNRLRDWRGLTNGVRIERMSLLAIESFVLFAVWKHGFVRADGHVAIFFSFALIACVPYLWLASARIVTRRNVAMRWGATLTIMLAAGAGINTVSTSLPWMIPISIGQRIWYQAGDLLNLPNYIRALDQQLQASKATMQLPRISAAAGNAPVVYYGILPGPMAYQDFAYQPMPSTISFAAWNRWIAKKDRDFLQREKPPFIVASFQTIDNRSAAQDDALAQLEFYRHYRPVVSEQERILLQRWKNAEQPLRSTVRRRGNARLSEWISLPAHDEALRIALKLPVGMLGKLIGLLYKPSIYEMDLQLDDGSVITRRFMARMAADGFLVAPLIETTEQYLASQSRDEWTHYTEGKSLLLPRVTKLRIRCQHLSLACSSRLSYRITAVSGLRFGQENSARIAQMRGQLYGFDAALLGITAAAPLTQRHDLGKPLWQCHAPCRIRLQKPTASHRLRAEYGLFPSAYSQGGMSNGIGLTVRFDGKIIWRHILDPRSNLSDQMTQHMDIALPKRAGVLTLEADTRGNGGWDQFYIDRVALQ